jgi:hypothetical protein
VVSDVTLRTEPKRVVHLVVCAQTGITTCLEDPSCLLSTLFLFALLYVLLKILLVIDWFGVDQAGHVFTQVHLLEMIPVVDLWVKKGLFEILQDQKGDIVRLCLWWWDINSCIVL